MAKWFVICFIVLAILNCLCAKPLNENERKNDDSTASLLKILENDDVAAGVADTIVAAPTDGLSTNNQPILNRKKRQYYYYGNSIYNPYGVDYNKRKKNPKYPNRRGFKSTTQRYTIWDLS